MAKRLFVDKLISILLTLLVLCFASSAETCETFRVMAYNAWLGGSSAYWTSQGPDAKVGTGLALQKAAAFLYNYANGRRSIIGVQEVSDSANCTDNLHVAQTIDNSMGSGWANDYFPIRNWCSGTYGLANVYNVPKYKEQEWRFTWDPNNEADWGVEPRGANVTKHDFGGGNVLWFVNTHLGSYDDGTIAKRQLFELLGRLKSLDPDQPVVVVGDFNIKEAMPDAFAALFQLFDDPTLSGFELVVRHVRMYIFVCDPHNRLAFIQAADITPVWAGATLSDHNLLVAEFQWR